MPRMFPLPGHKYRKVNGSVFCVVRHVDVASKRVHIVVEGLRESQSLHEFNAEWRMCATLPVRGVPSAQ